LREGKVTPVPEDERDPEGWSGYGRLTE
jgi:hypothetical protein